jgi:hypothetical protein
LWKNRSLIAYVTLCFRLVFVAQLRE